MADNSRFHSVILIGSVGIVGSNTFLLAPILTNVANSLEVTTAIAARAAAMGGIGAAISALVLTPLLDRFGAERALRLGLMIFALAMFICAASPNLAILSIGQAFGGAATGVVLPCCYALATTLAPKGKEASMLGRVIGGWSLSMILTVPVSALIADALSWRVDYMIMGILALAVWQAARRLPADAPAITANPVFPKNLALFVNCPFSCCSPLPSGSMWHLPAPTPSSPKPHASSLASRRPRRR